MRVWFHEQSPEVSVILFQIKLTTHTLYSCALQNVAVKVLSIPPTLAAGERLFSTFKYMQGDLKGRLLQGRMWMLAYCFFNSRVLKRRAALQ